MTDTAATVPSDLERLCVYCEENPAEPGLPCCDNGFCKAEWLDEQ